MRVALSKKDEQKYAIKTYEKFKLNDVHKRKNTEREISILKLMNHKYIVKLIEIIDTSRSVYKLFIVAQFSVGICRTKFTEKLHKKSAG